ncbi:hypothetical protein KIW84_055127 [Lathyrus oleraceus]|uniref:Uncharacterized protein n=1 Tax=Pisum sativum TaxID=3888 RepID=A0A9D5AKZ8_PEA|nr:hypothetical protein KIW84_055127 [Pisum sativum]
MNCKEDALSNVLVVTGSSLNVLPKTTLSKLSYQGAPMRYSGVIVKALTVHAKQLLVKWTFHHLSSFSYIEAKDKVGTPFQALSITAEKRFGAPMSSLKDAKKIMEEGNVDQWGRMVEVSDNKGRTDLGFQKAAVLEDDEEEDCTNFVMHGKACNNWTAVDVPIILHRSKLVPNLIEYNDPSPSPNFEFLVFEAEEESDVEVSDELSRLLKQDEKTI